MGSFQAGSYTTGLWLYRLISAINVVGHTLIFDHCSLIMAFFLQNVKTSS